MRYYLMPEGDPSYRAAPYTVQYALEQLERLERLASVIRP